MPEGQVLGKNHSSLGLLVSRRTEFKIGAKQKVKVESMFYQAMRTSRKSHSIDRVTDSPHEGRKRLQPLDVKLISVCSCYRKVMLRENRMGKQTPLGLTLTFSRYILWSVFPLWNDNESLQEFSLSEDSSWSSCISEVSQVLSGST
uniref:Uncharacterized protein n=1 Tax=Pipistrellus kuhlii TaxID=59472 RepID=A0A7J7ZIU4_PIPKU|nr:hypothetical protein mPipKuh1_009416 [Pipistrellus kuhlii]